MWHIGAALLLTTIAELQSSHVGCRNDGRVIGKCFQVHGRLHFANGNPSLRMWRVGTKRYLGVVDDDRPIVPVNLAKCLIPDSGDGFERTTYGDFTVCPFTPSRPGRMQMVCIESARNIVVRDVIREPSGPSLGPAQRCEADGSAFDE